MKLLKLLLIITGSLIFSACSSSCDNNNIDVVASLYALTLSSPDMVPQFVNQYKDIISSDDFNDCIDNFSNALKEEALTAPSKDEVYDRSMNIAAEAGYSEMGPRVADDMIRVFEDMLTLSRYLQQLKISSQNILNGNLQGYQSTEIYYLSSAIWNMSGNILYPQQVQALREMMFKLCYWYVSTLMQAA